MANSINYAEIFQPELDKQLIEEATSGWMEPNAALVKYSGGREVKIPSILMDGLGDYDRGEGFVKGSVSLEWETQQLTQDRGRTFTLDAMDVDESNFVATAGVVLGEFQRTKVIPEVDAYRYSTIASKAIAASKAVGDYSPTEATILAKLLADIAAVQDEVGEGAQLIITLPITIASILTTSDKIQKRIDVVNFKQGEIDMKIKALDGHILKPVPSARMKTEYIFHDGSTAGQTQGGFSPADTAKNINWLITAKTAPLAISKTDVPRVFDPETNQSAHAWKIDYRKYHDLWIPKNKLAAVRANIKEAL
ncbi:hypothetical protein [Paenibacillus sanguinis]|uniref:hypothetical protein n=1 Tax=Paenibacillus sanguinis TaxID=225906 RepID=UPI0003660771|nr:hypothetical protein [Paenibacillus sanguinis]